MCFYFDRLTNSFKNYSERKQLVWYMLYGYGIPCVSVIVIYIIDHIESIPDRFQPQIGGNGCLMREKSNIFLDYSFSIQISSM